MKKYILVLALAMLFVGCSREEKVITKEEALKTVFITLPKIKDKNEDRIFNGTASSHHQINLSFKVQGNITYFKYQLGDKVKKGKLIAKLDSKPYELKVSKINYALSEANAGLINAKSSFERTKKLYINQNASVRDIDNARALYDSANAKVKNIQEELAYGKLQLSYTKLYAPRDGYISLKYVQENENIAVGTPIVLISDKLVDEVRVQVPEIIINKIKKDDVVRVAFTSVNESKPFYGKISEISKFTSKNNKTYTVIIKLKNSSTLIKSGMSADVLFNLKQKKITRVFLLPSNSVLNDKDGYFVYLVVKEDGNYKIKRRAVVVGNLTKDGYEILNGINLKDYVLKAGMSEVYKNMQVQIGNLKDLGK